MTPVILNDGSMLDAASLTGITSWQPGGWDVALEVLTIGGAAWASSWILSAIAAYRHKKNGGNGMPTFDLGIFDVGLDWIVGILGIGAGLFLGKWMGPFWQTVSIGAGLGGFVMTGVEYGAVNGMYAATSGVSVAGLVSGMGDIVSGIGAKVSGAISVGGHAISATVGALVGDRTDRTKNLSKEAQDALREYEAA